MKITIIGLDKWGYNKYIAQELQRQGHKVRYINYHKFKYEYPTKLNKSLNFITKTVAGYNFKDIHLEKILSKVILKHGKQDYILVIKGDELNANVFKLLKNNCNHLIGFFNDSMKRYPKMKNIHKFMDEVYSFEPKDSKTYNFKSISNFIYFDLDQKNNCSNKYNIFNISSLSKRSDALKAFENYFIANDIDYKLIALNKNLETDSVKTKIDFISSPLPIKKVLTDYVCHSRILLDIQRPHQEGLSFRVLESLGLQKKLITTNTAIKDYDFYNPNNILIVDPEKIHIPKTFLESEYQEIPRGIVEKYHVSSWVKTVFQLH